MRLQSADGEKWKNEMDARKEMRKGVHSCKTRWPEGKAKPADWI